MRLRLTSLALCVLTGCQSLSTVRTETPRLSDAALLRFDRAVVVVYTGEGARTREVHAANVIVRADSAFWTATPSLANRRPGTAEAMPTRWVQEVRTAQAAPNVGTGFANGLIFGLLTGGVLVGAGLAASSESTCSTCFLGVLTLGTGVTGASAVLGGLFGLGARETTRHILHPTPPGP